MSSDLKIPELSGKYWKSFLLEKPQNLSSSLNSALSSVLWNKPFPLGPLFPSVHNKRIRLVTSRGLQLWPSASAFFVLVAPLDSQLRVWSLNHIIGSHILPPSLATVDLHMLLLTLRVLSFLICKMDNCTVFHCAVFPFHSTKLIWKPLSENRTYPDL